MKAATVGRELTAATADRPLQSPYIGPKSNRLRLQTLVRLRWLAVAGQAIAVISVHFGLGFPLPLGLCLAAIAASAWLNIYLSIRYRANLRMRNRYAAMLLAYDILQLAVLLYLTGGLQNPFSFLFLVPATVSASTLPMKYTIPLVALTLAVATILAFGHLPLPWTPEEPFNLSVTYTGGIWAALVCGLCFLGMYVWRISEETKRMSEALAATEMVLAREQQLSALDGLAAAAAHELGTPLATMALVARELKRDLGDDPTHGEDLDLLISQANRCREILSTLTLRDDPEDKVFGRMKLSVMLEEIADPLRGGDTAIAISADFEEAALDEGRSEPMVERNPGVLYGITNLVDNAIDFAGNAVNIAARWDHDTVSITIVDDGPGFAQEVIDKLGEPYVTTRSGHWMSEIAADGEHEGMGLGFFIAKTLLERSGAVVAMANRTHPDHGAIVRIVWPRDDIDAERRRGSPT